jgi:tetratricopeptide (TPR) repeat protein
MKKVILAEGFVSFILIVLFVFVLPAIAEGTSENPSTANPGASVARSSSAAANEIPMFAGVKKTPEQLKADSEFVELAVKEKGGRAAAAEHMVKRGWEACDQNDFATAVRRFNQAWLIDSHNAKVYNGFGVWARKQQKIGDAVRYLKKAVELCGTDPVILYNLGFTYNICAQMSQDKPEHKKKYLVGASGIFEKASKLEGVKDTLFDSWSASLYQLGNYEKALEKLEIQKKMGGNVSQERIDHIKGLINKNKKMPAAQHFAAPEQGVGFYLTRGMDYCDKKEYVKAISDFDKVIELLPELPEGYCSRGLTYFQRATNELNKDDAQKALIDFDKAIKLDPSLAEAYSLRAVTYLFIGKYDNTIADFNKVLELDPGNASAKLGIKQAQDKKNSLRKW